MTTPSAPARCSGWCDEHAAMTEPEERKTSGFLSTSIVIAALLIFSAVLVMAFSPMLWTDHILHTTPMPAGCSIESRGTVPVAHCPVWVQYP